MACIRPWGYFKSQRKEVIAQVVKWFISFSFCRQPVSTLVCPPNGRGGLLKTRSGHSTASSWLLGVAGRCCERQELCLLALFLMYPEDLNSSFLF